MSQDLYLRSKLLNQANIFAEIQSLWSEIISLARAKSLSKLFFADFFFFFPAHFTTNLWPNTGKKTFYHIIYKLNVIQENAFSEASFSTLVSCLSETISWCSKEFQSFKLYQIYQSNKSIIQNTILYKSVTYIFFFFFFFA